MSLNSASAFSTNKVFNSKQELVEWAREIGKRLGYIIVISSSQPQKGGRKARLRLGCERGGTYRTPKNITSIGKKSRSGTGTRKINCPFMLQGVKLNNGDDWIGFGENYWKKIREDLVDELCGYRSYYVKVFGSELVAQLLEILSYFKVPAPKKYWMVLPDMGYLVATRYNVVLVHISKQQCLTYLPLRSNPPPQSQQKMIAIGLVNSNHFVQVLLDDAAPIPPIVPDWKDCRHESAAGWDTKLLARIKDFEAIISMRKNSRSGEIINVDDL